jgi:hypothetical protein
MEGPGRSPLVPLPSTVTIPTFQTTTTPTGTTTIPSTLPFYYAGISSIWLYWRADLRLLDAYLREKKMAPVAFDGAGVVAMNFFNAVALYGAGQPGNPGAAGFNETEINILACAADQRANVPELSLSDFLLQGDQTKRIGAYRVWVLCDNPIAIAAGRQLFFENKVLTAYKYDVPALNYPGQSAWSWTCYEGEDTSQEIYDAQVSLTGLSPTPGNMSEWIDLSWVEGSRRVAASRRTYFGMMDTYFIPRANHSAVRVNVPWESAAPKGTPRHDVHELIGNHPAFAVQLFRSPPCIAEARPYWADL